MTTEEKIWSYLKGQGMTDAGAAGLMGNIYAESGLRPNNLQNSCEGKLGMTDTEYTERVDSGSYTNFVWDSAGYGLCQWTHWSRKADLHKFAKDAGKSIGDLEMQLGFLMKELSSGYKTVLTILKTATSVRATSDAVLLQFERPADQSEAAKSRRASYGQKYFDKYAKKGSGSTVAGKITTGKELAAAVLNVANNYKTLYVMGCFGAPMTAANKKRYTKNAPYNRAADRTKMINAASADTFGFDCVCLIKGLLWGWSGDASKTYGGAGYAVNGVPDIGEDEMIRRCAGVTTDFSKIEVGEVVWCKGHIGVYIGSGLAVECTPKWKNCVQVTACNCAKSGYDRRNWTKHGKLPYVTYAGQSENVSGGTVSTTPTRPTDTEKKASEAAKSLDRSLAGTYTVTAKSGLHIRDGAGTGKNSLTVLPKGTRVRNYGYYTEVNGVAWLYIQVKYQGVKYTGFSSGAYLSKV